MRETVKQLWEEVKANHARLDLCNYHEFERIGTDMPTRFKCKYCQGEIDGINYNWYMKGMTHAKMQLPRSETSTGTS